MLDQLEREFGSAAFARFWSSGAPMPQAFANAFGTSLGSWVQRWASDTYPSPGSSDGRSLSIADIVYALGCMGLAATAVALWSRRRQV